MRKVRVAHVITRLCRGGAQENTFHTVRLADRARFEADLISGWTRGHEGSIEDAVRAAGIDIIREPALVRPVAPVRDVLALFRLTHLFRSKRYDIVHTHTSKAGFLGRLAANRAGIPIVVHTPHGHIFHGYFPKPITRIFVWAERHAARRTDRIITLMPAGIEQHLAEGIGRREQYVAVFSGIDLAPYDRAAERRDETRRALGVAPDDLLVGGVGRLEPVKGFSYFVEAAGIAAQHVPNVRFVVAGTGSQAEKLKRKAAPLGERFGFLGQRDDVPDLMAALDVFVAPSLNEGMGRVLLEAGAAGVPAVATAVGGIPDVLDAGRTGLLVAPRDADALTDAIVGLAADPDRRRAMGEAARRKIVPDYGLEAMVRRIEALYEQLIEEKGLHY